MEINENMVAISWFNIKYNQVTTMDDFFQLGDEFEHPGGFLSLDKMDKDVLPNVKICPFTGKKIFWETAIIMSDLQANHSRRIYSLLDVLGDFGGL